MTYFNFPSDLAAALHALAEDVAALPPFERMPDLSVQVNIQACQHDGTPAERIAAVDLLTFALLGQDATTYRLFCGDYHHSNGRGNLDRGDGLNVAVYTAVPAPAAAVAVAA